MGTNPKEIDPHTEVSYQNDIQPIFNSGCVGCHGSQGQLSLTTYANTMKGGVSGKVVIPGNGEGSLIVKKLRGIAPGQRMPPEPINPLSGAKIDLLVRWISTGAENN